MTEDAEPEYDDFEYDDRANVGGPGSEGCYNCSGGWLHGCCDDLCRGSSEAFDCDNSRPCPVCNVDGGYMPL